MILFRFFILIFFNASLKLSSTDWQIIETDPLIFLDRLWKISWSLRIAVVFERSNSTSEKKVKGCAGSGIALLMPEHPFTLQNFLLKFTKSLANWIVPEKFKWSHFLPMQRTVMFILSTSSILSCKRWLVNCLTAKFVLALADRIVAVERMVWYWGHFSLMKVFSFSNLSKISLEVQDSVLFVPTWRIKRRGFLSSIDTSLCCMSSIVAPGKLRTFTTPFFPYKCSSRITLIMESPAITVLDYALILLSIFLAKEQLEIMRWFYCQLFQHGSNIIQDSVFFLQGTLESWPTAWVDTSYDPHNYPKFAII